MTLLSHGAIRAALTGTSSLPPDLVALTTRTATADAWDQLPAAARIALAHAAIHGALTLAEFLPPATVQQASDSRWVRTHTTPDRHVVVEFVDPHLHQHARHALAAELSPEHQADARADLPAHLTGHQSTLSHLPGDIVQSLTDTLLHDPATRDQVPDWLTAAYLRLRRVSGLETADDALLTYLTNRAHSPTVQLLVATAEALARHSTRRPSNYSKHRTPSSIRPRSTTLKIWTSTTC